MEEAAAARPGRLGRGRSRSSRTSWTSSAGSRRRRRSSGSTSTGRPPRTGSPASGRSRSRPPTPRAATSRIIEELTGRTYDEIVFTGGAAKGRLWPQIVADVLGVAGPGPAGQGIDRARGGDLRRPRRRPLRRPRDRRRAARPVRAHVRARPRDPGRLRRALRPLARASIPGSSTCPRPASSDRCGGRPAPEPPARRPPA